MGLCKCPKKKVTNLFCFEHTVNVCEHCLVANHSRCVVQSYLQWLQDSDYDPSCRLCGKNLSDESCGPCVRLVCYDIFHWACLDNYARNLPATTAPAGYACPICNVALFPGANVVSPVVDILKEFLSKVNWARAGLGLPMIQEPDVVGSPMKPLTTANGINPQSIAAAGKSAPLHKGGATGASENHPYYTSGGGASYPTLGNSVGGGGGIMPPTQSIVAMDENAAYSRAGDRSDVFGNQSILNLSHDHDQDKYKRRPAFQWFSRWFNSRTPSGGRPARKDPNASTKRFFIILFLFLIGLVTMVIIFSKLGRSVTDDDPFLDPLANPNIRVEGP